MFENCFQRTRKWRASVARSFIVVVLFAIGMIAAATHVHSLSRAFASIGAAKQSSSAPAWSRTCCLQASSSFWRLSTSSSPS